jgi:N-acyl amino acid synthase of PEP-CTERM/exosortase system
MSVVGTVGDHFSDYFDVRFACTEDLIWQVHRLRYEVYCREFGYEREETCPGGQERDDYDEHSLHCLIVHRESGMGAGCIRVVVPPREGSDFLLPMERFCGSSLTDPLLHPARLPRSTIAEVSRLAVHTQFRRRAGESQSPVGRLDIEHLAENEKRSFPLLGLALFCAGTSLMRLCGREEAFVMMERRLARRLTSTGFPFSQIGEPLEYHGPRAAYHVRVQQVLDAMPEAVRPLHQHVNQSLEREWHGARRA